MKYSVSINISKPINEVIRLFDDPNNLKHSFPNLEFTELISGTAGQPGAITRMTFKNKNRTIVLIEKILVRNYPDEFTCSYDTKGVYNIVRSSFKSCGDNCTTCISEQEFRLSGFVKVIGWLMPGAFKKESMKHLIAFKNFAESV
jgi:hypothetical protein